MAKTTFFNKAGEKYNSVVAGIEAGDTQIVLIHAADARLSAKDTRMALVDTLVVMAERSESAAEIVGSSVRGVESSAGGNSHELERAGKLRELATALLGRS